MFFFFKNKKKVKNVQIKPIRSSIFDNNSTQKKELNESSIISENNNTKKELNQTSFYENNSTKKDDDLNETSQEKNKTTEEQNKTTDNAQSTNKTEENSYEMNETDHVNLTNNTKFAQPAPQKHLKFIVWSLISLIILVVFVCVLLIIVCIWKKRNKIEERKSLIKKEKLKLHDGSNSKLQEEEKIFHNQVFVIGNEHIIEEQTKL